MASEVNFTFSITGWKEDTVSETDGSGRIVRAHVSKVYEGEIEGKGTVEYLMAYKPDGTANFVGYEVLTGTMDGEPGSIVFEHIGTFEEGVVDSIWMIVDGSGSGAFDDAHGNVKFSAGQQESYDVVLSLE